MTLIDRRLFMKSAGGVAAAAMLPAFGARAQGQPIRIAFIGPLSGAAQIVGTPILAGAEIAVAQANAAGGVGGRLFELVVRDDKGDPTQTVAAARELSGDGVKFFVGAPLTATAVALSGIMADLGGVYVASGTGDERLAHELFSRNVFTALETNYVRAHAFADVMARRWPDVTKWIGIIPDVSVGRDSWARVSDGLKKFYGAAGKEVTLLDPVVAKFGSTDFKNQIVALMSSEATGLYSVLFGQDGVTFFKQAATFDLASKFTVIGEQALDVDLPKALKGAVPSNLWSLSVWYPGAHTDNPDSVALVDGFSAKTGDRNPPGLTSAGHTATKALTVALAKVGNDDIDAVITALEGLEFQTVKGPSRIRKEDHQLITQTDLINFGPSADGLDWSVKEFATTSTEAIVDAPDPGNPLKL